MRLNKKTAVLSAIGSMISIQSGSSIAKCLFPLMGPAGAVVLRVGIAGLLLALAFLCAEASVPATPNQKLAFRTGPNTKYVELYSLPQSTSIRAIEYEEGNGVTWVLVEFEYAGSRVRAYTGLKRMSLSGYVPYAQHDSLNRRLQMTADVYAAPDMNATVRARLSEGSTVTWASLLSSVPATALFSMIMGLSSSLYRAALP